MDAVAGVGLWSASRYFVRLAPCWPRFAVCCFLGGVDGQHPPKHGEATIYYPVNSNRYGHISIVDHFPWKTIGFPYLCHYAGGHVSFFGGGTLDPAKSEATARKSERCFTRPLIWDGRCLQFFFSFMALGGLPSPVGITNSGECKSMLISLHSWF